ncbi:MAG: zinc chelation protein SecC, partial [Alphaproteobacteria bacterium]|nr:zinc chelation protein SecC [Alphaproteobacteria bacterium]
TSRLLVEFALGEAMASGGREPGRLQLSRIMSKLLLIVRLGGWSDAIRWDAMEPRLRVTALGDIQANQTFHEEVIAPYAKSTSELRLSDSMEGYAEKTDDPAFEDTPFPVNDDFPVEFWDAWKEQFGGVDMEVLRALLRLLDDEGMGRREAVFRMRKSELLAACKASPALQEGAAPLLEQLTFRPRQSWRQPPDGFDARDLFPWRFRRRLSILRRPFVQLTDDADPEFVIAPGVVGDAVGYMLGAYHRGDFHRSQLTPKMNKWAGRASDRRGHQFALEVGGRMTELGWQTRVEEKVTALLRKGFPIDYGDVDVLAWKPDTGRVVVIECKDVQYRKTDGEIAEQLADFRGIEVDGKRDLLLKHLDRLEVIRQHTDEIRKSLSLTENLTIEGELVFRNPVPMQFAWEQLRAKTDLHVFSTLHMI